MMKKIPYKLLAVSTFLTLTTTSVVSPVAAFASEIQQTNTENTSLGANTKEMQKALADAKSFAQSMNEYSYLLITNPDVKFEGITLNGYPNLPSEIIQDQHNAREHAKTWDTQVKKDLLNTLTGIIEYDNKFDKYYKVLVKAMNAADAKTLTTGIKGLQGDIQANKATAETLIKELNQLKTDIGKDVRAFKSNKDLLYSILKNQTAGLEDDQKRLDDLLGQVNYYKKLESDGFTTMKVGVFGLWWIGGIIVGTARDNLGKLEPYAAELRQTVDNKTALNRVVTVAHDNITQMHSAIDKAINALTYMSAQWGDLDAQYAGLLSHIKDASESTDPDSLLFLEPNLESAKESWTTLKTDATTLKDGLKELKVEPITPQQ